MPWWKSLTRMETGSWIIRSFPFELVLFNEIFRAVIKNTTGLTPPPLTVKYPVFYDSPWYVKNTIITFFPIWSFFKPKFTDEPFCSGVQDASQTQEGKEIIQEIFILLTTNVSWNTFPLPLHCFVQQTWVWKKWKLFYSFLSILRLHDSRLRKLVRSDQLEWKR